MIRISLSREPLRITPVLGSWGQACTGGPLSFRSDGLMTCPACASSVATRRSSFCGRSLLPGLSSSALACRLATRLAHAASVVASNERRVGTAHAVTASRTVSCSLCGATPSIRNQIIQLGQKVGENCDLLQFALPETELQAVHPLRAWCSGSLSSSAPSKYRAWRMVDGRRYPIQKARSPSSRGMEGFSGAVAFRVAAILLEFRAQSHFGRTRFLRAFPIATSIALGYAITRNHD